MVRIAVIAAIDRGDTKLHALRHAARDELLLELLPIHLRVRAVEHLPVRVAVVYNNSRLVPHRAIAIIEPERFKLVAPHPVIIHPRRERRRIHQRHAQSALARLVRRRQPRRSAPDNHQIVRLARARPPSHVRQRFWKRRSRLLALPPIAARQRVPRGVQAVQLRPRLPRARPSRRPRRRRRPAPRRARRDVARARSRVASRANHARHARRGRSTRAHRRPRRRREIASRARRERERRRASDAVGAREHRASMCARVACARGRTRPCGEQRKWIRILQPRVTRRRGDARRNARRHKAMTYRPLWWMPVKTYAGKNKDARRAMENGDGRDEVGREATKTKAREMFARWLRDAKGARLPAFLTPRR